MTPVLSDAIFLVFKARVDVCSAEHFDQFAYGKLLRIEQYLNGTVIHPPKFLPQSVGADSAQEIAL